MAKRLYESDVRGVRRRGRNGKCWVDGVKKVGSRDRYRVPDVT